ncbi:adenylyl cyclase X E-like [Anastrepha obliqua]|uniref:adenylyl cyclase X E-like n=1 Tax=Anastrepha obliqua TaxID=95512 RepID=UPI0024092AF3|nr:adenylyl cyclase X E-like [Anastrepha obliqua]
MIPRRSWARDSATFLSFSTDKANRAKGSDKFELTVLREQCTKLDVEEYYLAYMNRVHISQLYSFISMLVFIICVHSLLLFTTVYSSERKSVYGVSAIYLGSAAVVILILSLNFSAHLNERLPWLKYVTTTSAIIILVAMDLSIPIVNAWLYNITKPMYYSFIIISIYIFMPFTANIYPVIMGVVVSIGYIIVFHLLVHRWKSNEPTNFSASNAISEGTFILSLNVLGLFVRLTRETVTRMTFVDKRHLIEENILFHAAKDQERALLLTIIPKQIAAQMEEDVKMRIELMKKPKPMSRSMSLGVEVRKLFIEPHDDVTILYADIVNYTRLTTTLDVSTLVGTLHDLFVRFDNAAQELKVLRIQFLGDCYYCVGNVSIPNEEHAVACVKLGLRMIKGIREVRDIRDVLIDMRIGVHTGSVLSGVIGENKWQFDIYSKDVVIANKLESTGVPGRVHISKETLHRLHDRFKYEEGTQRARDDPLLRKHHITTFLITPPPELVEAQMSQTSFYSVYHGDFDDVAEGQVFEQMDSLERMKVMLDSEMNREYINFPISGIIRRYKMLSFNKKRRLSPVEIKERTLYSNISWLFMWYKNWHWELSYLQQFDILYKYSIAVAYIIILCTIIMQAISEPQETIFWMLALFGNIFVLLVLGLVWYKKMWERLFSTVFEPKPQAKVSLWMYITSDKVQRDYWFRTGVYFAILLLQLSLTLAQLLDCDRFQIENEIVEMEVYDDNVNENICFSPWAVTECIVQNLGLIFLFTHVPYFIKYIVALLVLTFYIIISFVMYEFIFERSLSSNQYILPEYAQLFLLLIHLLSFHIVNREAEFISRMDYNSKYELRRKRDNAKVTNKTISILIGNILPAHIADMYMKDQLSTELYYEQYENVAVMFATILNYDTEQIGMRVLNEIICDFDRVLNTYTGINKIEKIKVAGWTYMAACGLSASNPDASISVGSENEYNPLGSYLDDRLMQSIALGNMDSDKFSPGNVAVYIMACFALDLICALQAFNMENPEQNEEKGHAVSALRIGISNGPVMAGVVGSYKPFYDIWGNAVNMASRMDSTGLPDSIQVTEETAKILETFNIKCNFRGETFVKGRGLIPTYLLEIDENFSFNQRSRDPSDQMMGVETNEIE